MQVATCLSVDQSDDIAITNEPQISSGIVVRLLSVGVDEPVVVGIFVVVAGDLLLHRSLWEGLNVGVQKPSSVSHIFECDTRPKCKLKRAVSANLGTL